MKTWSITVEFDEEASVYFVEQSEVAGLHAEEPTMDAMVATLRALAPELLAANGQVKPSDGDIPLVIHTTVKAPRVAA